MKYYYGLINNNDWGFVDEKDPRHTTPGLIELTEAKHSELIEKQGQGLEIVYYNGRVFNAPAGDYYVDDNNIWHQKTEEEKQQEQEAEFNRQFFLTSLGYVRRSVSMKDGSHKDFLSDILPLLQVGVPILTYTRDLQQNKVLTTEQFIGECKQQLLIDFYGVQ